MWQLLTKVNIHIPCNSAIQLFCIYLREEFTHTHIHSVLKCSFHHTNSKLEEKTTCKNWKQAVHQLLSGCMVCGIGILWNNAQQYKGMNYGFTQQHVGDCQMYCAKWKPRHKTNMLYDFFHMNFYNRQNYSGSKQNNDGHKLDLAAKGRKSFCWGYKRD